MPEAPISSRLCANGSSRFASAARRRRLVLAVAVARFRSSARRSHPGRVARRSSASSTSAGAVEFVEELPNVEPVDELELTLASA